MEFRSLREVSFKVLLILLVHSLAFALSQNCGVPRVINVKQSDRLTETLDTGQILVAIQATNIHRVQDIPSMQPDNFAVVQYNSTSLLLKLLVNQTLWPAINASRSFIDSSKQEILNISVILECQDGRDKEITFRIPIIDQNTQVPRFQKSEYNLSTEPCTSERCMLLFETEIVVIDEDRDKENALVEVTTDSEEVEILTSLMTTEQWHGTDDGNLPREGFQTKVKLGLKRKAYQRIPSSVKFTLTAKNTKPHVDGVDYEGQANVFVTFKELPERILPPVFSSQFYYANVDLEHFGEELKIRPVDMLATVPWDLTDNSKIIYRVSSQYPNILYMDPLKGSLRFSTDVNDSVLAELKNKEVTFNVFAERSMKSYSVGNIVTATAKAKLVLFFPKDAGDPVTPTTEYPSCSPECYSTVWPGTCPTPACPDPDPCPGPSTPEFNDTTITTTETWTTDTSVWSTMTIPITKSTTTDPQATTVHTQPTTVGTTTVETQPATSERHSTTTEAMLPTTTGFPTDSEPTTTDPEPTNDTPELTTELPQSTTESTTETMTNVPTSTSIPPPTHPPGDCICDCDNFKCENPQTKPTNASKPGLAYYPDPFECTKYHRCENKTGHLNYQTSYECPKGTVFCPIKSACLTVENCLSGLPLSFKKGGYGDPWTSDESDATCDDAPCDCFAGVWPDEPGNVCTHENHQENIADPVFCDVYHQCQPHEGGFIDYPKKCPLGTVFCSRTGNCEHYNDYRCFCLTGKIYRQCDVCVMGIWEIDQSDIGHWKFDLFERKFVLNTTY